MRERAGYGLNIKHKKDFLLFAKDDIPYFQLVFTLFFMSMAFTFSDTLSMYMDDDLRHQLFSLFRNFMNILIVLGVYFSKYNVL